MATRTQEKDGRDQESVLPPGQRDRTGFWYPAGYEDPATMVRRRPRRHAEIAGEAESSEDLTEPR
ncbi:MAG TPA: hypothetical protein VFD06_03645 [Candidatus Polarisedimenticolia bacterium]|nr:hypothetical protein [Candidatus Polarisedimenticolia bacterium]